MSDSSGVSTHAYDPLGRVSSYTAPQSHVGLAYTYDQVGNRTEMTSAAGRITTTYAYDPVGNLVMLTDTVREIASYTYDALNRETGRYEMAFGILLSRAYDAQGNETSRMVTGGHGGFATYTAGYDPVGNRLTAGEVGSLVTYSYDSSYQLINEQRSGANAYNTTYTYDGLGNRLTKLDQTSGLTNYSYNAANAQTLMTPATGAPTTQTYDPNGNLTLQSTGSALTSYTWDQENRMAGIQYPTGSLLTNTYSADGVRQAFADSTGINTLTYDGQNVYEKGTSAGVLTRYANTPGYWGGLVSSDVVGGASEYYSSDMSGNVRQVMVTGPSITATYLYSAFGQILASSGSIINPFQFGGQYGYQALGNNQYMAGLRVLDAIMARWASRDKIEFRSRDRNPYRYVKNRPVVSIDPSGMGVCDEWMGDCLNAAEAALVACIKGKMANDTGIQEFCVVVCALGCLATEEGWPECMGPCLSLCEGCFGANLMKELLECHEKYDSDVYGKSGCCPAWSRCCARHGDCLYQSCPPD